MCSPVTCRICGKTTWAGCGLHIEHALAGVPADDRCKGHRPEEVAAHVRP
jgi:hypothetical protein